MKKAKRHSMYNYVDEFHQRTNKEPILWNLFLGQAQILHHTTRLLNLG